MYFLKILNYHSPYQQGRLGAGSWAVLRLGKEAGSIGLDRRPLVEVVPAKYRLEVNLMQISFHGAVQTVTGSQHLIRVDGKSLLLDCGLYQGKRDEARRPEPEFPL